MKVKNASLFCKIMLFERGGGGGGGRGGGASGGHAGGANAPP